MYTRRLVFFGIVGAIFALSAARASAQPFGVELHNTMLPAAGGMGGVSIAQPQDLLGAINANPAALTHFRGTQFQLGGGWAEATFNMNYTGTLAAAGISPYYAKSGTPGTSVANIGMTQQFDMLGHDTVFGLGLISNAGAGVDFRDVPQSNGTSSQLLVLEINPTVGTKLTDRLSVGAGASIGSAFFDGPFVGLGAMVPDYGLRGTLGMNYEITDATKFGFYYQTKQHFTFEDAIRVQTSGPIINYSAVNSIRMDLPSNFGFGIANQRLCNGRLLLASDILLKRYSQADLFNAVYDDQLVFQFGAQYAVRRLRLRAGYVYAENPLKQITTTSAGGVALQSLQAVEYVQTQLALINRHRISFGVGIVDLVPGLDVDMYAGGMLRESAQIGQFADVNVESYWIGLGSTYRFGRMGRR